MQQTELLPLTQCGYNHPGRPSLNNKFCWITSFTKTIGQPGAAQAALNSEMNRSWLRVGTLNTRGLRKTQKPKTINNRKPTKQRHKLQKVRYHVSSRDPLKNRLSGSTHEQGTRASNSVWTDYCAIVNTNTGLKISTSVYYTR